MQSTPTHIPSKIGAFRFDLRQDGGDQEVGDDPEHRHRQRDEKPEIHGNLQPCDVQSQ
jgi:hypothetical protein